MKAKESRSSVKAVPEEPQIESSGLKGRRHERQFRLAFDSAPIGMAIVGLDYRIKRVNKSLCDALGYSEEELLANKLVDISHPDDVKKGQELADRLFRGQIPSYRLEKRFITKDGSPVWLDVTAVLIRESQGKPAYGLAMVENITERKRILDALRTSEQRYRSFVVNSSEGIWRFEVEQPIDTSLPTEEQVALFYKHAYLAECNDALARMYGHQCADDLIGVSFGNFLLASSPANTRTMRKFVASGYRLLGLETEELDTKGVRKHISSNVIGTVMNGMLLRVWGVQRDQTEQKRTEEELKHSRQQLRALAAHLQSMREKERADIAREMHDVLGQSLASLKIDISWLRKQLRSEAVDGPVTMDQKLKEMNRLLQETIASVKALSTELRPGVLDQFGLAAAVEWQCEEFARRTGIKCDCHLPQKELAMDREKSTALFRILQEALFNVARHSGATSVRVDLSINRSNLMLTVHDNGRGISPEEILAPASLGLLGMRERTELLRGHFSIQGTAGKGTTLKTSIALTDSQDSSSMVTGTADD